MANTTNFGWETPDDTDLVKDGAAAIRTLGSSIDTSFVDLKGGTTGQLLAKASNTDMDFTWATPAGGGKVLQVVSATYSTATTSTSSAYADTGLSLSITPTLSTSKVLAIVSQNMMGKRTADEFGVGLRLVRGATVIWLNDERAFTGRTAGGTFQEYQTVLGITYLDSPATTSATTYKTQFMTALTANSGTSIAQGYGATSTITLLEIGA